MTCIGCLPPYVHATNAVVIYVIACVIFVKHNYQLGGRMVWYLKLEPNDNYLSSIFHFPTVIRNTIIQLDALGDTFGGVGERYPGNPQYNLRAILFFNIKLQKIFWTLQNHSQSLSTSKPIFQKLPFKNLFFNCDLNGSS